MSRESGERSSQAEFRTKKRPPMLNTPGYSAGAGSLYAPKPGVPTTGSAEGYNPHSNSTGGLPYGLHPPPSPAIAVEPIALVPNAAANAPMGADSLTSDNTSVDSHNFSAKLKSAAQKDRIPVVQITPSTDIGNQDTARGRYTASLKEAMDALVVSQPNNECSSPEGDLAPTSSGNHLLTDQDEKSRDFHSDDDGDSTSEDEELPPVELREKRAASWGGSGHNRLSAGDSRESSWGDSSLMESSDEDSQSDASDSEAAAQAGLQQTATAERNKKKKKAFFAAREMMTSESTFVSILKLINEDFRVFVATERDSIGRPVVPMTAIEPILKSLPLLQKLNEEILADVTACVQNWTQTQKVAHVFVRKGPFLKMYTDYIREYESICAILDDAKKKYPEFDAALKKFQARPQCGGMELKHFLLKPIQRIPQYRLMLREYLKYQNEESPDYEDTKAALAIVSEVADHANKSMRLGDNLKEILEIQHMLEGQFELVKPGRYLLKKGQLQKQSRKEVQPRTFFLFNDLLLCTTFITTGFYRYNQDLPLTAMKVLKPEKPDPDFPNEFDIITRKKSYALNAATPEEREEWMQALQDAIKEFANNRRSYMVGRPSSPPERPSAVKIGNEAPLWVPDGRVTMCMMCSAPFTLTYRRHHCRCCGKVVCSSCSRGRAPLRYLEYKSARVCNTCLTQLQQEGDILEREVEIYFAERAGMEEAKTRAQACRNTLLKSQSAIAGGRASTLGRTKGSRTTWTPSFVEEVRANQKDVDISGYLKLWEKQKWKKRWFLVRKKVLFFFKAGEDRAPYRRMPLIGFTIRQMVKPFQGVHSSLLFEAVHTGVPSMVFRAENPSSKDSWVKTLMRATSP